MSDFDLPTLRNRGQTVRETLNDNAYGNVLPARYLKKDESGAVIEDQSDLFERVAQNVAVGAAFDVCGSGEWDAPADALRQDVWEQYGDDDVWSEYRSAFADEGDDTRVPFTDETAPLFGFETVRECAPASVREHVTERAQAFTALMERVGFVPNTPTLANAGDRLQMLSACFVNSPVDDIEDIHETVTEASLIFQSGGGMGYSFSHLRPFGDVVGSTGGIASGPITFMRTYDQVCETIAQGGMRRGAQMGVMEVWHPDIIQFIHAKDKDVSLAQTLRLNDPDDFTHSTFGEALAEARNLIESGQVPEHLRNAAEGHLSNFNISVGVTDEFMQAVENGDEFTLVNPRTDEPHIVNEHTIDLYGRYGLADELSVGEELALPARELWRRIVAGAHENGEPGVIFIDRVNADHTFDVTEHPDKRIDATNPCITGDTLVATADGRGAVPIEVLTGEDDVPVYTRSEDGVTVGRAKNIRKTRTDAPLVEIETDGEVSLTCTPDHPIWTRNRGWVEASDLERGDSLHMLYDREHSEGYRSVEWTGSSTPWNLEHRMVAESLLELDISGQNVHHINGDKHDNRPRNLELMNPSSHGEEHARDISGSNNPIQTLKEEGRFEEYKQRNSFYETSGEENPMSGERDEVTCLECGETFRSVSHTHLRTQHDMTTDEYREKYPEASMVKLKGNHKVESVESAGTADVYDLEVPETSNFYAGDAKDEFINIHNCGEQPLLQYEACNLGHINLATVVSERLRSENGCLDADGWRADMARDVNPANAHDVLQFLVAVIDVDELNHRIDVATDFLDCVVTMSHFPVAEIREVVRGYRKLGLGIMGLAHLFVQIGVPYGSELGNRVAERIMKHINQRSKRKSHQLAQDRGLFDSWEESKYADPTRYPEWFERQTGRDPNRHEDGYEMRNHSTTTIAPTGSTSMVGNTSAGCEPIYSVANYKNVSDDVQGDEMLVQFDSLFEDTLAVNDIDPETVKSEATEQMANNEFDGIESLDAVPDELADLFVTTSDLSAKEHASVQCSLQPGVDAAISKTVNAPNDSTVEDAKDVFEYIYQNGGKGVTYYRDGSRSKQVLTTRQDNQAVDGVEVSAEDVLAYIEDNSEDEELLSAIADRCELSESAPVSPDAERTLAKRVGTSEGSPDSCPTCGSAVVYREGCESCSNPDCSWGLCK